MELLTDTRALRVCIKYCVTGTLNRMFERGNKQRLDFHFQINLNTCLSSNKKDRIVNQQNIHRLINYI